MTRSAIRERVVALRWTRAALRQVRRDLDAGGLDGLSPVRVPQLSPDLERAVLGVLRLSRETCLVKAVVRQSWYAAHGDERTLVIGVTPPGDDFEAHAWLDGDDPAGSNGYTELVRRPPHRG